MEYSKLGWILYIVQFTVGSRLYRVQNTRLETKIEYSKLGWTLYRVQYTRLETV